VILPSTTRAQHPTRSLALHRSVHNLTEEQLDTLRQAFRAVMQIGDNRGYNFHAGIHGLPLGAGQSELYCRHDLRLWLPWHRAYLYLFELALRDRVSDASLPWWDWASPVSHSSGIPEAYTQRRLDGQQENPLFSAPISENAQSDARRLGIEPVPTETYRDPRPPNQLPDTDWAVRRDLVPSHPRPPSSRPSKPPEKGLQRLETAGYGKLRTMRLPNMRSGRAGPARHRPPQKCESETMGDGSLIPPSPIGVPLRER
jgi:hypothetical protein